MENLKITWEKHADVDGSFLSTCGRFEARIDPVYAYLSLHRADDPGMSLGEAVNFPELSKIAEAVVARDIAIALEPDMHQDL